MEVIRTWRLQIATAKLVAVVDAFVKDMPACEHMQCKSAMSCTCLCLKAAKGCTAFPCMSLPTFADVYDRRACLYKLPLTSLLALSALTRAYMKTLLCKAQIKRQMALALHHGADHASRNICAQEDCNGSTCILSD